MPIACVPCIRVTISDVEQFAGLVAFSRDAAIVRNLDDDVFTHLETSAEREFFGISMVMFSPTCSQRLAPIITWFTITIAHNLPFRTALRACNSLLD